MNTFSERELKIIKIIGRRKLTLAQITMELFQKDKTKPFDSVQVVGNSIRRIIKKCHYHKLDWTLTKHREDFKLYIKKEKV